MTRKKLFKLLEDKAELDWVKEKAREAEGINVDKVKEDNEKVKEEIRITEEFYMKVEEFSMNILKTDVRLMKEPEIK